MSHRSVSGRQFTTNLTTDPYYRSPVSSHGNDPNRGLYGGHRDYNDLDSVGSMERAPSKSQREYAARQDLHKKQEASRAADLHQYHVEREAKIQAHLASQPAATPAAPKKMTVGGAIKSAAVSAKIAVGLDKQTNEAKRARR